MNNKIGVSIIVPIYNVENYLQRCLDSILVQRKITIEVICVEDCSTDHSKKILKMYEHDRRVKCIYNESNLGLGATRNVALDNAKGKYIWFVDSDDWIEGDSIENLFNIAEKQNLDLVCFSARQIIEDSVKKDSVRYRSEYNAQITKASSGEEVLNELVRSGEYDGTVCRKIFRRDLISDLRFDSNVYYEDELFALKALLRAKRVVVCKDAFYNYYRRSGTITVTSADKTMKHLLSVARLVKGTQELLNCENEKTVESLMYIHSRFSNNLSNCYGEMAYVDSTELMKYPELLPIVETVGAHYYNGFFPFKLSEKLIAKIRKQGYVYIYGAGKVGRGFLELLREKDVDIDAFLVTDCYSQTEYEGVTVLSIDELPRDKCTDSIVFIMVTSKQDSQVMKKKARSLGVKESNIYEYFEVAYPES